MKDGDIVTKYFENGYKYLFIRKGPKHWVFLHRHNWELANGPVPAGMLVAFKDGNYLNCCVDNLFLETQQEHMKRNTIARFSPELRSVIHLQAKVKRKMQEYEKQD